MSHCMSHGMCHHMSDFDERSFARCSSHRIRHGLSHHVSDEMGNHLSGRQVIRLVMI
jgi:hypothetical protein